MVFLVYHIKRFSSKMSVMVLNRKLLRFMGIHPVETTMEQKKEIFTSKRRMLIVLSLYFTLMYGSFAYIYYNLSDIKNSTNALIVVMAAVCGVGCFCGIRSNSKHIHVLLNSLQEIVDGGMYYV